MSLLQKSIHTIKYSSIFGLTTGFSIGLWLNMNTMIKYKNGNKITKTRLPLCIPISIFWGLIAPISIALTPLSIVYYIFNGTIMEKTYDNTIENIKNKYNISLDRHYQYGVLDDKYSYPSHITINIEKKELD